MDIEHPWITGDSLRGGPLRTAGDRSSESHHSPIAWMVLRRPPQMVTPVFQRNQGPGLTIVNKDDAMGLPVSVNWAFTIVGGHYTCRRSDSVLRLLAMMNYDIRPSMVCKCVPKVAWMHLDGGTFLNLLLFFPLSQPRQYPSTPIVTDLEFAFFSSFPPQRSWGSKLCCHRTPHTRRESSSR